MSLHQATCRSGPEGLIEHAREHGYELRFIEMMPLGNGSTWDLERVVRGEELRRQIHGRWPLDLDPSGDPHAPATRYKFRDGRGTLGFVDSISAPFCAQCSRLRMTADGQFRVCLYDDREVDLREPIRSGATDEEIQVLIEQGLQAKGRGGALDILESRRAIPLSRSMHQIGG